MARDFNGKNPFKRVHLSASWRHSPDSHSSIEILQRRKLEFDPERPSDIRSSSIRRPNDKDTKFSFNIRALQTD